MSKLINNKSAYELPLDIAQVLVRGIVLGNKAYANERVIKKDSMIVSAGYSWTRSNHIDDAILRQLTADNMDGKINAKIATAGYFWDYLQFTLNNGEDALFIVKPGRFRPFKYGEATDQKHLNQQSIKNMMSVNAAQFTDSKDEVSQQLELFGLPLGPGKIDEEELTNAAFSRFYILTYTLNTNSEVDKVELMMPNPIDNKIVTIQDLSEFIGNSKLTSEERNAIATDQLERVAAASILFDVDNTVQDDDQHAQKG